jgi:cell division protein FtsB
MAQDEQKKRGHLNRLPPIMFQYTIDQYIESPALVKRTNEWVHSVYQYLAEKDKDLQRAEQEMTHLKEEYLKLKDTQKLLEERTRDFLEMEREFQLAKQELNHLKEGSLKISIAQHALSLMTALSFGIGINLATSTTSNGAGWPLIFMGAISQSISFYITYFITYADTRKGHP